MIETKTSVPAELMREFAAGMWRHVQQGGDGPLAQAPELVRIVERAPDQDRARQLQDLLTRVSELTPEQQRHFTAAADEVQVNSKLWLIDELTGRRDLAGATLVILGAWYGVLPLLFNWRLENPPARMLCVDFDADACALGQQVIGAQYDNIGYQVADITDLDYATDPPTVLINTICEHLHDATAWWRRVPHGQLTVLQSNNYDKCRDHVNCVQDLEEMKAQTPLSEVLYEGVLPLSIFDRFMLIGHR